MHDNNIKKIPDCMGMERSGSTLAWQMASRAFDKRLNKTHEYIPGDSPGLYTYRNPIESFVSLLVRLDDVYPRSIAKSHAIKSIYLQTSIYTRLLEDYRNGRNIIFLKYEDSYENPQSLLLQIIEGFNISISQEGIDSILFETSIEKNKKISEGKNFGEVDDATQLHGNHINPKSKGRPGFFIDNYSGINDLIKDERIIELCDVFGYNLK